MDFAEMLIVDFTLYNLSDWSNYHLWAFQSLEKQLFAFS